MKIKALIAIAAVVVMPSTFAQFLKLNEINPYEANDTGCALFSTTMLTGMRSQSMSKETAFDLCNTHPKKQTCISTKEFIEQNAGPDELKSMSRLSCVGSSAK